MSRPAGAAATVAAPYVTINDETVNNCIASDIVTPSRSGRQATDQVFSLVVPDRPKRDPGYPRHGSVQNVLIMDAAARLSPGAFKLYAVLAVRCLDKGGCFPGDDTLAKDCDTSERTIKRWRAELVRDGFVVVKRRSHKSNVTVLPALTPRAGVRCCSTPTEADPGAGASVVGLMGVTTDDRP